VTPISRPQYVDILVGRMLHLRERVDVRWLIVFDKSKESTLKPYFSANAFDWITVVGFHTEGSVSGNMERNAALDYLATNADLNQSEGFLFFLDDDNAPPSNLYENMGSLDSAITYFGDQLSCDKSVRLHTEPDMMTLFRAGKEVDLVNRVDTATFLISLSMWRSVEKSTPLRWTNVGVADGLFFTAFVRKDFFSNRQFARLENRSIQFFYNALKCP